MCSAPAAKNSVIFSVAWLAMWSIAPSHASAARIDSPRMM